MIDDRTEQRRSRQAKTLVELVGAHEQADQTTHSVMMMAGISPLTSEARSGRRISTLAT